MKIHFYFILLLMGSLLEAQALKLRSSDFQEGGFIPTLFTCEGKNISPALDWSDIPPGTKAFALILEDPDAPKGIFDHWVMFNLPPNTEGLTQGAAAFPSGMIEGKNSTMKTGYIGPCPPKGVHRYFFKLYALDTLLTLPKGSTKAQVLKAMEGHILSQTHLMGRYEKEKK